MTENDVQSVLENKFNTERLNHSGGNNKSETVLSNKPLSSIAVLKPTSSPLPIADGLTTQVENVYLKNKRKSDYMDLR